MTQSRPWIRRWAAPTMFAVLLLALEYPDLGFTATTDLYGGPGGSSFWAPCPQGSYLVGLAGRTGAWVDRIATVCAPWLRGSQTFGAPSIGQSFGASGGGQEHTAICKKPNVNNAVQSWYIETLRSSNQFVQYIGADCSPLVAFSSLAEDGFFEFGSKPASTDERLGNDERITPGPTKGGKGTEQRCPPGELAVGIHGRAGRFVDALGLICGPLPVGLGAPATKLPGPLIQAPPSAQPMNPQAKNMRVPDDMFVITKPAAGDHVPQGQLVITATPPKVGMTPVTELELRWLDVPPNQQHQQHSYPFTTTLSVETTKLLQGYVVAHIVTGAYNGRWQVRARASMKAVPGPWSFPVQFHLKQAPPSMQQAPLPGSAVMQAPPQGVGTAPAVVRPPTTPSQGGAAGSLLIRPRGAQGPEKQEAEK
ncbi:MAG: hypothetical protein ABW047_10840 [Nitrospiraceae bacterium]